jgi:carboxypeptidase Taq
MRYEIENEILKGELKIKDLPEAWNTRIQDRLGVRPANDAEGCLQDGHWADGLIGYFPTYTLGDVFAAQLAARANAELGSLEEQFARGEFLELVNWLRERVYKEGSRYSAVRLIERVTGSPPDHRPLVERLRRSYGELYGL